MIEDEIRVTVLESIAKIAPEANLANLDPNRRYRDQFQFDSVDFLNLALSLQDRLRVHIPELDYPKLATLSSSIEYLCAKLTGKANSDKSE